MSKTIAVHVSYKSLYIFLPSSAKQQREMTKFCVVEGKWTTMANFWYIHLELNTAIARSLSTLLAPLVFWTDFRQLQISLAKYQFIFYLSSSSALSSLLLKLPFFKRRRTVFHRRVKVFELNFFVRKTSLLIVKPDRQNHSQSPSILAINKTPVSIIL